MNKSVENYFIEGCGRCPLGSTPDCKVHRWTQELVLLREMILSTDLVEECKWGVPCYTYNKKNVLILSAFKDYCSVSFFKGSLLKDRKKLLDSPGKNSQAARLFKFTDVDQIKSIESEIMDYIKEAIEIEEAGLKIDFKKATDPIPEELKNKFHEDPMFKSAFESLTPGRQRGYLIYFSAPKQSTTRINRIEKCIGKIQNGEGLHDKYGKKK